MSDYRALGTDTIQPILTFRFSVALDGIGEFEATEVSGLGYEIEMIEDEIVGPSGSASLRKMPGHLDYDEIEITRPLSSDTTLWDWIKRLAVDGEDVNGVRSNGTIVLYDSAANPVAEWKFERSWPISYSVTDLDISDASVVTETIKITHEYLERTT